MTGSPSSDCLSEDSTHTPQEPESSKSPCHSLTAHRKKTGRQNAFSFSPQFQTLALLRTRRPLDSPSPDLSSNCSRLCPNSLPWEDPGDPGLPPILMLSPQLLCPSAATIDISSPTKCSIPACPGSQDTTTRQEMHTDYPQTQNGYITAFLAENLEAIR